jgi:hypothetical protein
LPGLAKRGSSGRAQLGSAKALRATWRRRQGWAVPGTPTRGDPTEDQMRIRPSATCVSTALAHAAVALVLSCLPPADKRLLHLRVSARGTEQQSSLEDDTHWPLIRPRMPRPCRTRDFDVPILRGSQFAVPSRLTSPRRNLALTNSLCARPPRCAVADRWTH